MITTSTKKISFRFKKFLALFLVSVSIAPFPEVWAQIDMPKIIKPSPSTSDLFKFQDYPVDYSTGLAQINIPIYEVTSGSLSVPISISYHASGRKVYDQDGPIALGWALSAGGSISRTIHGTADFGNYKFPYPFKIDGISNYNDLAYLQRIMRYQNDACGTLFPFYDTEYDIFSYSFPGNSGKFIFKDDNNTKTSVFLPYKPFVLTATNPAPNALSFQIVDDKGTLYQFAAAENTYLDDYSTTGWNLEKMISADKTDTISFTYTGGVERRKTISQLITYIDNWWDQGQPAGPDDPNPAFSENTSQTDYNVSRISEIKFRQGKVKFNLVNGTLLIDNIQIINLNNEVIKTINFNRAACYTQGEIQNSTNTLTSIDFKDKSVTTAEQYSFDYYPIINSDVNGPVNVRYCDWWGYYNNSGQHHMLPKFTVSALGYQYQTIDIGNASGNRMPSLEPLKSGVLKKITYPTGGTTEFIYDNNKCVINNGNGNVITGPGLRIYQIKSTDPGSNNITTRTFKYGANESGYGVLELLPDASTVTNTISYLYMGSSSYVPSVWIIKYSRERFFSSGVYEELSELLDRPVIYQEVTEYKGTETANIGKTVYNYDFSAWSTFGLTPKTIVYNYNFWNTPSLISQIDYKNQGNFYQKVKSIQSTYNSVVTEAIRGLHVERAYSTPQTGYGTAYPPGSSTLQSVCSEQEAAYQGHPPFSTGPLPIYSFSDYQIQAGYKNLTQTVETLYTDAGNIVTTTSYSYNPKNLISSTSTTTSKSETISSDIKYPFDYTGNAILSQMVSLNMLNYPVEQISKKGSATLKSVMTNYYNWGTSIPMIYPQTIDTKQGAGSYETRLRYYAYDNNGNPLSVSKENDVRNSYIWGYSGTYPIAEVKNAKQNEIFFTSFEDGSGWDNSLTAYDNTKSNSGKFSGRLDKPTAGELVSVGTNWLSVSLSQPTKFHYSGWVYSNGPSAQIFLYMKRAGETGPYTYTDNVSTTTTNQWVYVEKDYTVPADVVQLTVRIDNNGGGSVWFDDIRLHPSNAMMTTYTYEPLIGMTSQSDVNNQNTYFDFDNYGRLKTIRDMKKNILKTYDYKYQSVTP